MTSNYIIIFIVAILPLAYKYSFWLYVIQLKEYRLDRFKDYIFTPQGKSALFNFWFFIEFPLFLFATTIIFNKSFEALIYPVLFYFLVIQNIFVIGKIFRKKILKPKITPRLAITLLILLLGIGFDFTWILLQNHHSIISTYIIGLLLFSPAIVFICIGFSLPLVLYLKRGRMNQASNKTRDNKNTTIIGITGSYGKSSIKEYLSSILEQEGKTLKTPENQNTEMGVSNLILRKLNETYKYFVVEMGAYKKGEIKTLGNIANHKYGILTAVGTQHIGIFGNIENTKVGKAEIAKSVEKNKGVLYINWENSNIRSIKFSENLQSVRYGNFKGSDVTYSIKSSTQTQTSFSITYKNHTYDFTTNLVGEHNILNISGVIALALDLGVTKENLTKYLKNLSKPKNTLEIIKIPKYTLINDSYNLPESGALAAIEVLCTLKGSKVLVMDDIFELGMKSKEIHINLGEKIARSGKVDKVLYIGENFKRFFIGGLIKGGFKNENILEEISDIKIGSAILFEGRSSKKYLDKIMENV